MEEVEVSFDPTKNQIEEIKSWLIEENKVSKEGFFCNWNSIQNSFKESEIGLIIVSESVVGFITWFGNGYVTSIEIAEVKPGFTKKGLW